MINNVLKIVALMCLTGCMDEHPNALKGAGIGAGAGGLVGFGGAKLMGGGTAATVASTVMGAAVGGAIGGKIGSSRDDRTLVGLGIKTAAEKQEFRRKINEVYQTGRPEVMIASGQELFIEKSGNGYVRVSLRDGNGGASAYQMINVFS